MSRGRWTASARAFVCRAGRPKILEKKAGWFPWTVACTAVHDRPVGRVAWVKSGMNWSWAVE
ncbi:MAG: hypothetical protein U0871_17805 [Gemmataceae bacterium]